MMINLKHADLLDIAEGSNNWHSASSGDFVLDRVEKIFVEEKSDEMERTKTGGTSKCQITQHQRAANRASMQYLPVWQSDHKVILGYRWQFATW